MNKEQEQENLYSAGKAEEANQMNKQNEDLNGAPFKPHFGHLNTHDNNKQPTEAQVRKLWEWCGNHYPVPPDIDLNYLFKYAVPRVEKVLELDISFHRCHGNIWSCILTTYKGDTAVIPASFEYPALALFWAIWEVIHG